MPANIETVLFVDELMECDRVLTSGSEYINIFRDPENFPLEGIPALRETQTDYIHEHFTQKPLGYYLPTMRSEFVEDVTYGIGSMIKKIWEKVKGMIQATISFVFGTDKGGSSSSARKSLDQNQKKYEKKMQIIEGKLKDATKVTIPSGFVFYKGAVESAEKMSNAFNSRGIITAMSSIEKALSAKAGIDELNKVKKTAQDALDKLSASQNAWNTFKYNSQIAKKQDESVDISSFKPWMKRADKVYTDIARKLDEAATLVDINETIQKVIPPSPKKYDAPYIAAWKDVAARASRIMVAIAPFSKTLDALHKAIVTVKPVK